MSIDQSINISLVKFPVFGTDVLGTNAEVD